MNKVIRVAIVTSFSTLILLLRRHLFHLVGSQAQKNIFCDGDHVIPSYNICNGLSNQLLGHAAHLSHAIKSQSPLLKIPDAFLTDGLQSDNGGPTKKNSIPLSAIIDPHNLIEIAFNHGINACLVPYKTTVAPSQRTNDCHSWRKHLEESDDELTIKVLDAMKPSVHVTDATEKVLDRLKDQNMKISDGVCLHHRNGQDWKNHCDTWQGNNCLGIEGRSIESLVTDRIPSESNKKWVYYIGDQEPSQSLILDFESRGLKLVHRVNNHLLDRDGTKKFLANVGSRALVGGPVRNILAAVDFFVCSRVDTFIGNSASNFSALQIALRRGKNSSWYNSRSVPLSSLFDVYRIPIIYTYTEMSNQLGKIHLKVSILSLRNVLGPEVEVNVIYHGSNDSEFLNWLKKHGVIVHSHKPRWLDTIERLRKSGSTKSSHLFADRGNYIGTWQRIDIPLFINAEYALFLDCDTVISDKFTLTDFGPDITQGIAMSSEIHENHLVPSNAGVALLNIPHLRHTYDEFIKFITEHAEKNKQFIGGPSDQGAYIDFYGNTREHVKKANPNPPSFLTFLDIRFNIKPYYKKPENIEGRKITHFHGMKPHHIINQYLRNDSDLPPALGPLANFFDGIGGPTCAMLREYGLAIVTEREVLKDYCGSSLFGSFQDTFYCIDFFDVLVNIPSDDACFAALGVAQDQKLLQYWRKVMLYFSFTVKAGQFGNS